MAIKAIKASAKQLETYKLMNEAGWTPNRVTIIAEILRETIDFGHAGDSTGVGKTVLSIRSVARTIHTHRYAILGAVGDAQARVAWTDLVNEMLWYLIGDDTNPDTLRRVWWTAEPIWDHGVNTYFMGHTMGTRAKVTLLGDQKGDTGEGLE